MSLRHGRMAHTHCNSIFVYGTLMQGHIRARCWPYPPLEIIAARVPGQLIDLGSYPGLVLGEGWVAGERCVIADAHLAVTLAKLDEVEAVPQLYVRTVALVQDPLGIHPAHVYVLRDLTTIGDSVRIAPDPDGLARWKRD